MPQAHKITTSSLTELVVPIQEAMFRLRYDTFKVRLGWDVDTVDGDLEMDRFDLLMQARYIVAHGAGQVVDACWRLMPTLGPNMLADVFPQLLSGQAAPRGADIWELSRFAIATQRLVAIEDAGNPQLGFGPLSLLLMVEAARFAQERGISRYVTVTTAAIERMLKWQGLHINRLGPPQRIGEVMTVACAIEVDAVTLKAVGLLPESPTGISC